MNPRFIHIALAVLGLIGGLSVTPARAQDAVPAPAPPPGVVLHANPNEFPGLGLTISLPVDTLVETTMAGAAETISLRPPDSTWLMTIEEKRSRDIHLTPESIAREALKAMQASRLRARPAGQEDASGFQSEVQVLNQEWNVNLAGVPAAQFTARVPGDASPVIDRYTIFLAEPGRFVLMRLQCLEPEMARATAVFDAMIASARFRDPVAAATDRAAALVTGDGFLNGLTTDDYDGAITADAEWRRVYRPASSGLPQDAAEVAYQMIEIRRGARGDLSPERPRARWTTTDEQPGYVVRIVARYIDDGRIIDSESVFFATLGLGDRDEEAWTVRLRIRDGADEAVWTETGARFDDRLTVSVQAPGSPPTETTWRTPDRGYLTQVESFMLPRLLARSNTPLIFSFYCYNSTSGKLELRRDVLEPAGVDGEGWILRSRVAEGVAERETVLADDGSLIRAATGEGIVMEPLELERIHALWKSKGLPTAD